MQIRTILASLLTKMHAKGIYAMQASMPKQYLNLVGKPIAMHSLKTFGTMAEVGEIVIVCDPSYR